MAEQKQNDRLEHTYSSYVRIRDVALKTCQRRWTIGRIGKRGSGISVLAARHDDDDYDLRNVIEWLIKNWNWINKSSRQYLVIKNDLRKLEVRRSCTHLRREQKRMSLPPTLSGREESTRVFEKLTARRDKGKMYSWTSIAKMWGGECLWTQFFCGVLSEGML